MSNENKFLMKKTNCHDEAFAIRIVSANIRIVYSNQLTQCNILKMFQISIELKIFLIVKQSTSWKIFRFKLLIVVIVRRSYDYDKFTEWSNNDTSFFWTLVRGWEYRCLELQVKYIKRVIQTYV